MIIWSFLCGFRLVWSLWNRLVFFVWMHMFVGLCLCVSVLEKRSWEVKKERKKKKKKRKRKKKRTQKPSEKEWKKEKENATKPRKPMWKGRKEEKKKMKKTRPNPTWKGKEKKKKKKTNVKGKRKRRRRSPKLTEPNEKKKKSKVAVGPLTVGPLMCVYLPKCHHNYVFITWRHLKCVFSFHNSSLKNQRIEWWKQKLKTSPNKPFRHGTHIFWVTGDGNWKSKQHDNTNDPYVLETITFYNKLWG